MAFEDKMLLVLKPAEPLHAWVNSLVAVAEKATRQMPMTVTLEEMQYDSNCYIIPALSAKQAGEYLAQQSEVLLSTEFAAWCNYNECWPDLSIQNFISCFEPHIYFDWLSFQEQTLSESDKEIKNIILVVKPTEEIKEFLRPLLIQRGQVTAGDVDKKLDMDLIENGATVVVTDTDSADEVENFLEQHCDEIFAHQLTLWGGQDAQGSWAGSLDLDTFKKWFTLEIHSHTYCMPHEKR